MAEYTGKWDEVENELFEIAAEITALGDMIPSIFQNIEEVEPETPKGIKILLSDIRKRIENLRKYIGGNFRRIETGKGG
jgi:DNA-directed RNA polymerase subunit F